VLSARDLRKDEGSRSVRGRQSAGRSAYGGPVASELGKRHHRSACLVRRDSRLSPLPTGLSGISRSSSAACRMRLSSDRQAITLPWSSLARSSCCHWRTRDGLTSLGRRQPARLPAAGTNSGGRPRPGRTAARARHRPPGRRLRQHRHPQPVGRSGVRQRDLPQGCPRPDPGRQALGRGTHPLADERVRQAAPPHRQGRRHRRVLSAGSTASWPGTMSSKQPSRNRSSVAVRTPSGTSDCDRITAVTSCPCSLASRTRCPPMPPRLPGRGSSALSAFWSVVRRGGDSIRARGQLLGPLAEALASSALSHPVGELLGDCPQVTAHVGIEDRGGPVSALAFAVDVLAGHALHVW